VTQAQNRADADVVTAISNLENDAVKADLASEKLSELKVHVYGNAAVATYKDTYDIMIMGEHRAHTIIATDTFVKTGDEWKQVASHGAEAK
jgi:ketosteroid isomerase-like protein